MSTKAQDFALRLAFVRPTGAHYDTEAVLDRMWNFAPGGATFNGVDDPCLYIGYNILPLPTGGCDPVDAAEPRLFQGIEGHYYDGVRRFVEMNWDYVGADGTTRRILGFQINRVAHGSSAFVCVNLSDATAGAGTFVIASNIGVLASEFIFQPRVNANATARSIWYRLAAAVHDLFQVGGDGSATAPAAMQMGPSATTAPELDLRLAAQARWGYGVQHKRIVPAYGVNITIDSSLGDCFEIVPTDGVAFTINIPVNANQNAARSQEIAVRIKNTFGALGVATWTGGAGGYRLGAAWAQPANGFSRTITFRNDGTNWIEVDRTAVDVAN